MNNLSPQLYELKSLTDEERDRFIAEKYSNYSEDSVLHIGAYPYTASVSKDDFITYQQKMVKLAIELVTAHEPEYIINPKQLNPNTNEESKAN